MRSATESRRNGGIRYLYAAPSHLFHTGDARYLYAAPTHLYYTGNSGIASRPARPGSETSEGPKLDEIRNKIFEDGWVPSVYAALSHSFSIILVQLSASGVSDTGSCPARHLSTRPRTTKAAHLSARRGRAAAAGSRVKSANRWITRRWHTSDPMLHTQPSIDPVT
jgi:hypothetical protein